jgi:hypothetical protein
MAVAAAKEKRPSDLGWRGGTARKGWRCERWCRGIFFLFSSQIAANPSWAFYLLFIESGLSFFI